MNNLIIQRIHADQIKQSFENVIKLLCEYELEENEAILKEVDKLINESYDKIQDLRKECNFKRPSRPGPADSPHSQWQQESTKAS